MAERSAKSPLRWVWRGLWLALGLIALAVLAAGVAIVMLQGSYGATLVRDFANGRSIAGYGELEVGRIRGNVLGRFRIDEVSLTDGQGVWLRVEEVEIAWTPWSLTGRTLDLDLAQAASVQILRRPVREAPGATSAGGSFDLTRWRLELDQGGVDELYLAQGVAGPEARMTASARVSSHDAIWSGAVALRRLDAPGDELNLDFRFGDGLDARYEFQASPDGPVTALLGLAGSALDGTGQVSGDLGQGSGDAQLRVDDRSALSLDAQWSEGRLNVSGTLDLAALPQTQAASRRVSGPVALRASAPFSRGAVSHLDLGGAVLDADAGRLSVQLRPGPARTLDLHVESTQGALALVSGDLLDARSARFDGRLDLAGDRSLSGDIRIAGLSAAAGPALEGVEGQVDLSGPFEAPQVRWALTVTGLATGSQQADAFLGEGVDLSGEAAWTREAERIDLVNLNVRSASGEVAGEGVLDLARSRWSVQAASPALRVGAVTDLLGGAGSISLDAEGGFDGALEARASAEGFTPSGALASALSGPLTGALRLARGADGALTFDQGVLTSPELRLEAAGGLEGDAWTIAGDAVWSGATPISALTLDGSLAARFEAQDGDDGLQARVEARAPALSIGPEVLTEPRLRVEVAGSLEALTGEARLTGQGGRGAVDLAAGFQRAADTVRVTDLSGRAAGFAVDGSAEAGPERLTLSAALSPEAGFGQFALDADIGGGLVRARLQAEDLVFADLSYLDRGRVTLEGPLEAADVSFEAEGAYGAAFELSGAGRLALGEPARILTTTLEGRYGPVTLSSAEPLSVQFAPALEVSADLRLGQGRGVFRYADGASPTIEARLEDAPAAILSLRRAREPVEGLLSGRADLARADGVWTGSLLLAGRDLRPARAPEDRTLAGSVRAVLDEAGLSLSAEAGGADLQALADLDVETGAVATFAQLADAGAAIQGRIRADGRIGDFAAFHLDPAQRLTGSVTLEADISGALADPVVVGAARLADGRFRDSRAGLDLQALEAQLDLTRSGARLSALSAGDGQGGTLTGSGSLDIAAPLAMDAQLRFERFRLVDRHGAQAVGSGDVRVVLQSDEVQVTGETVIDRADITPNGRGRAPVRQIEVVEINRPAGLDPAPQQRAGPTIRIDYRVSAPRRVFVRGPNYDTEWGFDLDIDGTAQDPVLRGEARVVRGRADLLGRNFELERGQVILDGDPSLARLRVTARNERPDLTALIEVEGTVSDPQVRLRSQPALPEDEVASRILFGESAANLTGLQAAQLAGALASLSGGSGLDPLGRLRQAAGLDLLGVRRNAAGETVVSGGRYLTDDVFLQLESASVGAAPATRIDWTLTPRFTLISSLDSQGRAGLALSWRVEYDDDLFSEVELFRGFRDRSSSQDADDSGDSDGAPQAGP